MEVNNSTVKHGSLAVVLLFLPLKSQPLPNLLHGWCFSQLNSPNANPNRPNPHSQRENFFNFLSQLSKFSFFSFLLLSFLDHIYHQINSPWLYFLGLCNTCINRFVLYLFLFYFIYTVRDFAICLAFSQDEPALRKNFTSQTRSRSTPDWTPYKSLCLSLPFDVFYRRDDIKWVEHMPLSTHNALSKCRWKNTNDIHTKGNLVLIQ